MRELTRLTGHDMIAAFVRAELHAERFGTAVRTAMRRHRVPRRVVERPERIPDPLTVILGTSPNMARWGCY